MDDFGTGYSSLETLRAFPFDKIKLDRFFVSELERSPQATAIIRAVLALGGSLSIPVLAEGIETQDQLKFLHPRRLRRGSGLPARLSRTSPVTMTAPAEAGLADVKARTERRRLTVIRRRSA